MPHEERQGPISEEDALRLVLEGTVSETGAPFFRALVRNLCAALGTLGAWVTELLPEERRLRALAFWLDDDWVESYEYDIEGTPCQPVVEKRGRFHVEDRVIDLFPLDPDLPKLGAVSYVGVPLLDSDGALLGHLAVLDNKPMPEVPRHMTLVEIFAVRAASEYRRLRVEKELKAREEQMRRLLEGAMDGVMVIDAELRIVRGNPAAAAAFGAQPEGLAGQDIRSLFSVDSAGELEGSLERLQDLPEEDRRHWFPGALTGRRVDGSAFAVEATLSAFSSGPKRFHTLIFRDVEERIKAEQRIRLLTQEAEYLREEMRAASGADDLLGKSPVMMKLRSAVDKVAATEATVLIQGETGTGKELVARAVHRQSPRRDAPLVRVNCAAVPEGLIESEFFGHEKGAFTGATSRREGRFALADGGTIFLDEVGELPLDLQSKLLRVLQEGEFEPVGSSRTRTVDVRVIAATNRDLRAMVEAGDFREDLFYRLDVFPLRLPPLRERGPDIALLAGLFAARFAGRMGREIAPLDREAIRLLESYRWPGNVRELQNVIERALILSKGPRLDLASALPGLVPVDLATASSVTPAPSPGEPGRVLSAAEMKDLERDNLIRALEAAQWKISGSGGAASLLGVPPSTLSSRMKALGIESPGSSR